MNKFWLFKTKGASVAPEMEIEGNTVKLGPINPEYRFGIIDESGMRWASKYNKEWVVAIAFAEDRV